MWFFTVYKHPAEHQGSLPDNLLVTFLEKNKILRTHLIAGEEARHLAIFEGMAGRIDKIELPAGSNEAEYMEYVQALLDSHALFCGGAPEKDLANAADAIAAIELASRFEKDTILYFREMMDLMPVAESGIVKQVLDEERGHLRQLRGMLATLRRNA